MILFVDPRAKSQFACLDIKREDSSLTIVTFKIGRAGAFGMNGNQVNQVAILANDAHLEIMIRVRFISSVRGGSFT